MNGAAHLAIGAGVGWATLWVLRSSGVQVEPAVLVAGGLVAAIGAIVPDIDHRRSTVSRRVPRRLIREGRRLLLPLAVIIALVALVAGEARARGLLDDGLPLLKLAALLIVPAVLLAATSLVVSRVFGHRGATHSLAFAAAATLIAAALCERFGLTWWYGALFGLGWLSHLGADAMSRKGLPSLWWPFAGRR